MCSRKYRARMIVLLLFALASGGCGPKKAPPILKPHLVTCPVQKMPELPDAPVKKKPRTVEELLRREARIEILYNECRVRVQSCIEYQKACKQEVLKLNKSDDAD